MRIECASDEGKRHIIYPSFLPIHIEESTIPPSAEANGPPFFQERSSFIGLPVLVHKLAVELKGKSQDSVPVFGLYIRNVKALQMERMRNVSRSGEKGGMTTRACRHWL